MRLALTLIFSFLMSIILYSQESEMSLALSFRKKADSLASNAHYNKAILFRKRALNIYQSVRPVPFEDLVNTYRTLGYYYRKNGDYTQGEYFQKKAVSLAEQKLSESNPELIMAINGYGILLLAKGEYQQCLELFQRALNICLKTNCPELAIQHNNIGIALENTGNYGLAQFHYEKALRHNQRTFGHLSFKTSDNYINLGTLSYNTGQLDMALNYFDTCLMIYQKALPANHQNFAALYNNIGAVFNRKGDFKKGIEFLNLAIKNYEQHLGLYHPEVANAYANIGILFMDRGDLDKALSYFMKSWSIRSNLLGDRHRIVARTCIYLGSVYLEKRDYDRAYHWLNKGLNDLIKNPESPLNEIVNARNGMGSYFEKLGNFKDALLNYSEALKITRQNPFASKPEIATSLAKIGNIFLLQEKYQEARIHFLQALSLTLQFFGPEHQDVAALNRMIALSYSTDETCAREYSDNAFAALKYDPSKASLGFDGIISHMELLKNLQTRGSLLLGFYNKSGETRYLAEADQLYSTSFLLIEYIKNTFEEPGSRQALLDNFFKVYEQGILVKFLLNNATGKASYLTEAFQISEQSNATLLLEAIRSVQAEQFAELPDSLLNRERQLRIDLAFNEKQRFEEELKSLPDRVAVRKLSDRIFTLKNDYAALMEIYIKLYPKYFQLKYHSTSISVDALQKKLATTGKNLVSYFVGEEDIFVFVISNSNFTLERLPKDFPLEAWVEEFRNSISQFNPAVQTAEFLNQKYANIGFELYEILFKPILSSLNSQDIIIVTGGILGYLPFEALLSSAPENHNAFDQFDFLIRKYNFSYTYSASLIMDIKSSKLKRGRFIGFAPSYPLVSNDRKNDPWNSVSNPLNFNKKEVSSIHELMGGEIYLDSLATEAKFMERAASARILHLAAHAKANDQDSDYSFLSFYETSDGIENELVFVKNLYNMRLNAEMVVLSACETGIGELQRGEGIISLARGFSYAGAASIITTLWRIDDNASSDIMVAFYKNLNEAMPKDQALRQAKLEYLNRKKGSNYTHPLFWAAFIPIGTMDPITKGGLPWWGLMIILSIGVAAAAIVGSRYIKRPNLRWPSDYD